MALAHLILRIIYFMLLNKKPYEEYGKDYLPKKDKSLNYWLTKIKSMGYEVQVTNTEDIA